MLDAEAKAAYGHRLEQLREELDEAKELRNPERIAKAENEIDALSTSSAEQLDAEDVSAVPVPPRSVHD
jgi:hypothetical protein